MQHIPHRIASVRAAMREAAASSLLAAPTVELIAVSKGQPESRIRAALEAGQRVFGENRVQETQQKWPALRADYPDAQLHLIGALQTNKAREAVELFDVIQTLDRPALAEKLAQEMARQNRKLPCYIQVNTGEEAQKSGIAPQELADFHGFCRDTLGLPVVGLMCIPPADNRPALHFGLLYHLARRQGLSQLSMGMSGDYETAIRYGATTVRVGTALFGERHASPV